MGEQHRGRCNIQTSLLHNRMFDSTVGQEVNKTVRGIEYHLKMISEFQDIYL